jgi:hypothetical protein
MTIHRPMGRCRSLSKIVLPFALALALTGCGSSGSEVCNAVSGRGCSVPKPGLEVLYGFASNSLLNLSVTATIDTGTGGFVSASSGPTSFIANGAAGASPGGDFQGMGCIVRRPFLIGAWCERIAPAQRKHRLDEPTRLSLSMVASPAVPASVSPGRGIVAQHQRLRMRRNRSFLTEAAVPYCKQSPSIESHSGQNFISIRM